MTFSHNVRMPRGMFDPKSDSIHIGFGSHVPTNNIACLCMSSPTVHEIFFPRYKNFLKGNENFLSFPYLNFPMIVQE